MDKARERSGIKSDRRLGEFLGLAAITPSHWRKGRAFPSDDAIMKLSRLAGIDPAVGLMDLNTWRNNGETKEEYVKILQKLTLGLALVFGLTAFSLPSHASPILDKCQDTVQEIYIMETNIIC